MVTVINETPLYEGFLQVDELDIQHPRFDGGTMKVTREVVIRKDCVSVLPYDNITGKVVLVEQFRVGAVHDQRGAFVYELVAGIVDPGETVEQAARRELKEETGIAHLVGEMCNLGTFYLSPGGCTEQTTLLLAPVLLDDEYIAELTASSHGCANEGEDIRVHVLNIEDAIAHINRHPSSVTTLAALAMVNHQAY